jgi:hypothetical protein
MIDSDQVPRASNLMQLHVLEFNLRSLIARELMNLNHLRQLIFLFVLYENTKRRIRSLQSVFSLTMA